MSAHALYFNELSHTWGAVAKDPNYRVGGRQVNGVTPENIY